MSQVVIDSQTNPALSASEQPAERDGRSSIVARLAGVLPTALVLAALGGVGYWGHHSGWKMPTFAALTGAAVEKTDDWCAAHAVPESKCVECKTDLLPAGEYHGWCDKHGIPQCTLCNPGVAQLNETPEVTPADLARAERALAIRERPENNPGCQLHRRRIQFVSHDAVVKSGIDVDLADRQPIVESVTAVGEVRYDETRLASLSSRVPGTVWRVEKNIGDRVRVGDVLALVDAAEVGRAKAELLQALAQAELERKVVARLTALGEKGIIPQRQTQEAETELAQARTRVLAARQALINLGLPVSVDEFRGLSEEETARRIQFLGLPEAIADDLDPQRTTANLVPIRASLDGTIVERTVVAGEVVDASRVLFQIADTSRVWLMLDVPVEDAKYLEPGQTVHFRPDGGRGEVGGEITWISTSVDRETRTVAVRADIPNPDGRLRNETFGTGRIVLRDEKDAIVVPSESVHWDGSCHVAFVRDKRYFQSEESPKVFHTRTVRVGAKTGAFTEIIAGVLPGEVVATTGSGVLRGELLKNNLGAG